MPYDPWDSLSPEQQQEMHWLVARINSHLRRVKFIPQPGEITSASDVESASSVAGYMRGHDDGD